MALNITFAGRIYDEKGVLLPSARYQGFFYNGTLRKWNNADVVESDGAYNLNLGDGDWLTQDGTFKKGDSVLICAWIGDVDRNGENLTKYAFVEYSLDPEKYLYVQSLQLRPNSCFGTSKIKLPVEVLVGVPVTISDISLRNITYQAFNITHYQNGRRFNEVIFKRALALITQYNWGEGWTTASTHTFVKGGSFVVSQKIVDGFGCEDSSSTSINVRYAIDLGLTWDPLHPKVGEEVIFTPAIVDTNAVITRVNYYIDGKLVFTTTNKNASFPYSFETLGSHEIVQEAEYFDGITSKVMSKTYTLTMTNQPPIATINIKELDSKTKYRFDGVGVDPDGFITKYKYDIYIYNEFSNNWYLYYSSDWQDATYLDPYTFTSTGQFKVVLTVMDNEGAIGVDADYVNIECQTGGKCAGYVELYPFNLGAEHRYTFDMKDTKYFIDNEGNKISFDTTDVKTYNFDMAVISSTFDFKVYSQKIDFRRC